MNRKENQMNDTLREYLSYGSFILPLMKCRKTITPDRVRWKDKDRYFLYFPSPCKKSDTLVIYIHGGGWNSGSPSDFHFIGQKIANEGYDCIMPGYRKASKAHFEEIADDIFSGYKEIKKYLSDKKLGYSKTVVIGSSAGSHLGALLCYDSERQEKYGIPADEFDGFISLAGPLCFDLPQTGTLNTLGANMFGSRDKSEWKKGEPISKLKNGQKTKAMLIQSRHDGIIGFEQAEKFRGRATELGIPAELYEVTEKQDTHSAYSAGIFLSERAKSPTLDRVFEWLDNM